VDAVVLEADGSLSVITSSDPKYINRLCEMLESEVTKNASQSDPIDFS
jgi:hypothetical protein